MALEVRNVRYELSESASLPTSRLPVVLVSDLNRDILELGYFVSRSSVIEVAIRQFLDRGSVRSAALKPSTGGQGLTAGRDRSNDRGVGYSATTSIRLSRPEKSVGLRVYNGRPRDKAVAAIRRSMARRPRALRPRAWTAA
jgi:Arc/MetJ-type ribon-helix-helix transcriptional regulator